MGILLGTSFSLVVCGRNLVLHMVVFWLIGCLPVQFDYGHHQSVLTVTKLPRKITFLHILSMAHLHTS